ncbi:hypothetical protein KB559_11000 [Paenibacillus sp. Marseille-P2973]|uniref:hypothetical protein n=1 Tax=Paenibacillus sp. Marseille-P2973 TaxID=1871032 RepID=UPI001B35CCE0|nr:hypothetical protein [Paenibacillus sp. Marseille-P2973]MBQ4899364.1 hypothetical protein [Paenibacillus sp. Marseille-P2973]
MQKMYDAVVNSPKTELVTAITAIDTDIEVADASVLLQPEGLAVIGNGEGAETIRYTEMDGNVLKGCIRGFQGTSKSWAVGTRLARNFTAYDHDTFKENIEQHDTDITALSDRLDIADTYTVTLQAGIQVVHAERDSRFRMGEIKGRTLINLIGDAGSGEKVSSWMQSGVTFSLDSSVKNGRTTSLRVQASSSTTEEHFLYTSRIPIMATKYYLFSGYIKPGAGSEAIIRPITFSGTGVTGDWGVVVPKIKDATKFSLAHYAIQAPADTKELELRLHVINANGYANFSEISVYEITAAEYTALSGMTPEQVGAKYPFVPSGIVGVDNPYVIGYGENLMPPFYEVSLTSMATLIDAYTVSIKATEAFQNFNYKVKIIPGKYVLKLDSITDRGFFKLDGLDASGNTVAENLVVATGIGAYRFTVSPNIDSLNVVVSSFEAGTFVFKNPMLTLGSTPKPFKPRRDTMLALQTELHANPVDGSEPDVLFERDAQYFKLAKWKKVMLDGALPWEFHDAATGYKVVRVTGGKISGFADSANNNKFVTKYNGVKLPWIDGSGNEGAFWNDLNFIGGSFLLVTMNKDTGWGDAYTPTAEEIKAYFMGWKMYDGSVGLYPGTGQKYWVSIKEWGNGNSTASATLPTTKIPDNVGTNHWSPYQLLYRLAKETVEPVVSEGALRLNEGGNLIEVGTGIVLRERANPVTNGTTIVYRFINRTSFPESLLKNKTREILHVYSDNKEQTSLWTKVYDDANGLVRATFGNLTQDFNTSAAYSVTYIKLERSPIQPITGSLANNEKAQLSDLTAGVTEALQRVSVVEQKKAEKDAPVWIMPTLLNGWGNFSDPRFAFQGYKKNSLNIVSLAGMVTGGATGAVPIFRLPVGYRPINSLRFTVSTSSGSTAQVQINNIGEVSVIVGDSATGTSLTLSFLAEQ